MSIRKNEIPILEFDDNPMAVINPTHENQEYFIAAQMCICICGRIY